MTYAAAAFLCHKNIEWWLHSVMQKLKHSEMQLKKNILLNVKKITKHKKHFTKRKNILLISKVDNDGKIAHYWNISISDLRVKVETLLHCAQQQCHI